MIQSDHRLTFLQHAMCIGLAQCIGRTLTAPLDVFKVLRQIGVPEARKNYVNLGRALFENDGVRGFWKGNFCSCIKFIPQAFVQYIAFREIRLLLTDELGRMTSTQEIAAGCTSWVLATIASHPLDTVKTRLIAQSCNKTKSVYSGITNAIVGMVKKEGFLSLYKGLGPTLLATIPRCFTTYAAFELMDIFWSKPKPNKFEVFLQGLVVGSLGMIAAFPFDIVRKKMQAQNRIFPAESRVDMEFRGMNDCFKKIWAQGFGKFWTGLLPCLIRVVPYHLLMYYVYEYSRKQFLLSNGYVDDELDKNMSMDELQDFQNYDAFEEDYDN